MCGWLPGADGASLWFAVGLGAPPPEEEEEVDPLDAFMQVGHGGRLLQWQACARAMLFLKQRLCEFWPRRPQGRRSQSGASDTVSLRPLSHSTVPLSEPNCPDLSVSCPPHATHGAGDSDAWGEAATGRRTAGQGSRAAEAGRAVGGWQRCTLLSYVQEPTRLCVRMLITQWMLVLVTWSTVDGWVQNQQHHGGSNVGAKDRADFLQAREAWVACPWCY